MNPAGMASKSTIKLAKGVQPFLSQKHLSTKTPAQSSYAHGQNLVAEEHSDTSSEMSSFISKARVVGQRPPPLSIIPTISLLRSIAVNSISASPVLLPPSMYIMSKLAHAKSPIFNPDRNPVLGYCLKKTFYAQFCAGENAKEVEQTINSLKSIGFKGVMLGYAKEVVLDEDTVNQLESCGADEAAEACIKNEILPWKKGTLETVALTHPGDFVSVKFTGAGSQALFDLARDNAPSPALESAITAVCDAASARGVRLLFDAEQQSLQKGIDNWTINYMRRYNKNGKAVVHNTYQCYLKSVPRILAEHLATARKEGFVLGTKLVRGAYIGSDPRHLIHDTKADTDIHYDSIAESLMRKEYGPILKPAAGEEGQPMPQIGMVLAGHNPTSVRRALNIRTEQVQRGEQRVDMVYAQLQGMADEVSAELLQAAATGKGKEDEVDVPQAYKYLVWGSTGECMKYLLRRAQENKDAMGRTRDGRNIMVGELVRRMRGAFRPS